MTSPNPVEAVRERLDGGRKWSHGAGFDGESMCVVVAAALVADSTFLVLLHEVAAEQFPDRAKGQWLGAAINVNDHEQTTWADIDGLCDKAAVRWDEQVDR
jgi:hypothetical protein